MLFCLRQGLFIGAVLFSVLSFAQADTSQKRTEGRRNSPQQQKKPYVILISIDGFRYNYAQKHKAVHLQQYSRENIQAAYLLPSFPSLTFPNHYTLVTGLYPSHHGVVDNQFYDRRRKEHYSMSNSATVQQGSWYGGLPLWVLAEQQQMLSASFYWVGSEAPIQGVLPTYYYQYNEEIQIEQRIQTVVDWLHLPEDRRPHLITFYFPEVDHAGHDFGPDALRTGAAVRQVDTAIYRLSEAVKRTGLDVNFIVVADHGMTPIDTTYRLQVPPIDTSTATVVWGGELVHAYVKNKKDIPSLLTLLKKDAKGYSVVLKKKMPKRLYYRGKDDVYDRIGDILLISHAPYVFTSHGSKPDPGAHGFDPYTVPDMRTIFYAWGPAFKKGRQLPAFKNVDVFPLVAKILGLRYQHRIDGSLKTAKKALQK